MAAARLILWREGGREGGKEGGREGRMVRERLSVERRPRLRKI